MTRTQYYTATSLDGFVATLDHSLDWLVRVRGDTSGPLNYDDFIAKVGAVTMGAKTYQWILKEFGGDSLSEASWPYEVPCWVFTRRDLPVVPGADIHFVRDDVTAVHRQMVEAAAGRNIWLAGGGDLAGQFAASGLLDEVLLMIAPVTLGAGVPLLPRHLELVLKELGTNGDFACARYSVVRDSASHGPDEP